MSLIELKLTPIRNMYPKTVTDYRIYACETRSPEVELNSYGNITIKGEMQRLEIGLEYIAQIEEVERHPKYGVSYIVHSIYQDVPESVEEQREFLKAMLTETQVEEIYKVYPNENIVELIKNDTFDYNKVKGIGDATYQRIKNKITDNIKYQKLFAKLGKYGISHSMVLKLAEEFGSEDMAIQKIETNPYVLMKLNGISFKKADVIARNMGIPLESFFRIESGIKHVLLEAQNSGHTYLMLDELIQEAGLLLEIEDSLIYAAIDESEMFLVLDNKITIDQTYTTEKYIAETINDLLCNNSELNFDPAEFIDQMESKYKNTLSKGLTHQQKDFFYKIKSNRFNLLVGYAGTGKSQMQKLLIELLEHLGLTYTLSAPTGKAAKVLSNYTGRRAITLHKAIGYGLPQKMRDEVKISTDFLVIDEGSMPDIFLIASAFKKLSNPNVRILIIGDAFQIPSVGAGNFLHNLIESNVVPTTKLDIVFRQGEGGILDFATKIRQKEKFINDNDTGIIKYGSNLVIHSVDQSDMEQGYKHYYNLFLNKYKPEEIMVLSPTKKGTLGTFSINKTIQSIINPPSEKEEYSYGTNTIFRLGDYVINTKNTYGIENEYGEQTDVVNGDTGKIVRIVTEYVEDEVEKKDNRGIIIDFDGNPIKFGFNDLIQVNHAWSLTMHKSQGSSTKAAIIILDKAHKFQTNANLLYTALTRAVDYAVILCQADCVNFAMRKVENLKRQTFLSDLLRQGNINE